jgi:hypothetical protein
LAKEEALASPYQWGNWLKLRDSVPIGKEYRYCNDQIAYHYLKDKSVLIRSLDDMHKRHQEQHPPT